MQQSQFPSLTPFGDSGLFIAFGDTLDLSTNNAVHAFDAELRQQQWPEIEEITPAIRGLLIRYDPLRISSDKLKDRLNTLISSQNWLESENSAGVKLWKLPAHYGSMSGPEIQNIADLLGLTVETTIKQHSQTRTRVLMLGFAPGCAYLGSLPPNWDLPRLDYVKPEVPPGSLSVAVCQTVLFATAIPTGWQTIARTPFLSFTPNQEPYFPLAPGDEICFEPIDEKEFETLSREVAQGKTIVSPIIEP